MPTRSLTATLCAALALTGFVSAQSIAQGRHVFDLNTSQSSFTFSGTVVASGLSRPIQGNPANFNVSGAVSADLGVINGSITQGAILAGNGTEITVPTLNARVPNILPFLPPLATIQITGVRMVVRSVDPATGAPIPFPIQANGSFTCWASSEVLSGQIVVTGLANQTTPLAGTISTPQVVQGIVAPGTNGMVIQVPLTISSTFSDPAAGTSATINLNGNLVGEDRAFAADVDVLTRGQRQTMRLSAGTSFANAYYVVLGTASGTSPGLQFGSVNLPINFDGFTDFGLSFPNTAPYGNSLAQLDANGIATATFDSPTFPLGVQFDLHHAYALMVNNQVVFASNPIPVRVGPN
ncbi:MAG: hypothetical protein ACO4CT_09845 [Planctomycetota bacterium]